MEGWSDFFVAEVGAAAALAGLLVVAITINIERIISFPLLPGRAAQTLVMIGGALMIASFALLPAQPLPIFGLESLVIGLAVTAAGLVQLRGALRHRKAGEPLTWTLLPLLLVVLTAGPEIIGGLLLVAQEQSGLYCVAVGIILAFVATLENGWVLLVEILR